jgi:hypothetical protein
MYQVPKIPHPMKPNKGNTAAPGKKKNFTRRAESLHAAIDTFSSITPPRLLKSKLNLINQYKKLNYPLVYSILSDNKYATTDEDLTFSSLYKSP